MKTIEDAVIQFGGVWPEFSWGESKQNKHAIVKTIKQWEDVEEGKIYHKGYIGKGGTSIDPEFCEVVCTRSEFESCAKRLGYINGYRWGVEYSTNGKPELADDVLVEFRYSEGGIWFDKAVGDSRWLVGGAVSFRITDPRYKPVSEMPESKPDAEFVSESLDCKQNAESVSEWFENNAPTVYGKKDENNWHELGELPPVGALFDYVDSTHYHRTSVIHERNGLVWLDGIGLVKFDPEKFRPIRTHREKVIEAVDSLIHDYQAGAEIRTEFLNVLYDSGMLVLPQKSGNTKD